MRKRYHMCLECPLYAPVRSRFADLFSAQDEPACMHSFLQLDPLRLADFAAELYECWLHATAALEQR